MFNVAVCSLNKEIKKKKPLISNEKKEVKKKNNHLKFFPIPLQPDNSRPSAGAFAVDTQHAFELGRHRPGHMIYEILVVNETTVTNVTLNETLSTNGTLNETLSTNSTLNETLSTNDTSEVGVIVNVTLRTIVTLKLLLVGFNDPHTDIVHYIVRGGSTFQGEELFRQVDTGMKVNKF